MSTDRRLAELLDAATTDVPADRWAPPLAAIHRRARRRRRRIRAVSTAAVALVLAGGYPVGQRMLAEPEPEPEPRVDAAAASARALPWIAAMVARDDVTVTVFAGVEGCEQLKLAGARVRLAADAARVTIEVTGRTVVPRGAFENREAAANCIRSGRDVTLVVKLPEPLNGRQLVDAVGQRPRLVYFERHLPDLLSDGRWSPRFEAHWLADTVSWYRSYSGPEGSLLSLRIQPATSVKRFHPVSTVRFGPHEGRIAGKAELRTWTVLWRDRDVAYSLALLAMPKKGETVGSFTLAEFTDELARLWP